MKRKRVKASPEKTYVFPDGTRVYWVVSTGMVALKPAEDCGVQIKAGTFGGVTFARSVLLPFNRTGNPAAGGPFT